ncbi:DUF5133 domain-containing protein [Streptomyces sp. NPDC029526]|uniref:DUF5133 domain-containing protein n=1 Tax=Streptomyces sp. NPDC029526 TaxID=3155728 RepID=UPI0033CF6191
MLEPDPKVVRELLTRYATLQIAQAERHSPAVARQLEDVSYTLCVMTGTSEIRTAVARADALLARKPVPAGRTARTEGESGLSLAV